MSRSIRNACLGSVLLLALPSAATAQSTNNAAVDWSGSYGFKSNSDRNLRLLQSDFIRRGEGDYYDNLGKAPQYNVTNTSSTEIGQQTTTIGSVNTATNNIDVKDAVDIGLNLSNTSSNHGCLDGSVTIDSQPGAAGIATCN